MGKHVDKIIMNRLMAQTGNTTDVNTADLVERVNNLEKAVEALANLVNKKSENKSNKNKEDKSNNKTDSKSDSKSE